MEQWKRIVMDGVEYDYEVSTKGRVRNVKTGQILRYEVNRDGYFRVWLYKNGKRSRFSVHRIVAITFIPNDNNLPEVDHIDRNRQNNCVENLRWVSKGQNVANSDNKKRVRCVETGQIFESLTEASRIMNVKQGNLSYCLSGKYKTCGGFHWEFVEEE